jgi:hypothetical protein
MSFCSYLRMRAGPSCPRTLHQRTVNAQHESFCLLQGCPTVAEVAAAAPLLAFAATALAAEAQPENPASYEDELLSFFLPLLQDPTLLNDFFANECATEVLVGDVAALISDGTTESMTACVDKDGETQEFLKCAIFVWLTCPVCLDAPPGSP